MHSNSYCIIFCESKYKQVFVGLVNTCTYIHQWYGSSLVQLGNGLSPYRHPLQPTPLLEPRLTYFQMDVYEQTSMDLQSLDNSFLSEKCLYHDDVFKWKHFPRNWPFVRRIHRSPVNSPHKDHWREALIFSLICVWINGWVNNREAGDLRRYPVHYDVIVM